MHAGDMFIGNARAEKFYPQFCLLLVSVSMLTQKLLCLAQTITYRVSYACVSNAVVLRYQALCP